MLINDNEMLINEICQGAFDIDKEKNRKEDESEKNLAELKEQYNQMMRKKFALITSATYPDPPQQEDTEGTSARNKEIFRKRDEFECIAKKIMRMILATLPPVLDEQDYIKFKNKK